MEFSNFRNGWRGCRQGNRAMGICAVGRASCPPAGIAWALELSRRTGSCRLWRHRGRDARATSVKKVENLIHPIVRAPVRSTTVRPKTGFSSCGLIGPNSARRRRDSGIASLPPDAPRPRRGSPRRAWSRPACHRWFCYGSAHPAQPLRGAGSSGGGPCGVDASAGGAAGSAVAVCSRAAAASAASRICFSCHSG